MEAGEIAVRTRSGEDLGKMSVEDFMTKLSDEVKNRQ
jgi:threonyl-tRNA synthetase